VEKGYGAQYDVIMPLRPIHSINTVTFIPFYGTRQAMAGFRVVQVKQPEEIIWLETFSTARSYRITDGVFGAHRLHTRCIVAPASMVVVEKQRFVMCISRFGMMPCDSASSY
jgi:hypothetical protein